MKAQEAFFMIREAKEGKTHKFAAGVARLIQNNSVLVPNIGS